MADMVGDLIATEIARKGKQAELGGDLLEMFMNAIGTAVPEGLDTIPGFEQDGIAAKRARAAGVDISDQLASAQNAKTTTIPFKSAQDEINAIPGVEDLEPELRSLVESMFPQVQNTSRTIAGGGVSGGGGGVSSGMAGIADSFLNSNVTSSSATKSATPTPAPKPTSGAQPGPITALWNSMRGTINAGNTVSGPDRDRIAKLTIQEAIQLQGFITHTFGSGSNTKINLAAARYLSAIKARITALQPKTNNDSNTIKYPGLR